MHSPLFFRVIDDSLHLLWFMGFPVFLCIILPAFRLSGLLAVFLPNLPALLSFSFPAWVFPNLPAFRPSGLPAFI